VSASEAIAYTSISFFASAPEVQVSYLCETDALFFDPREQLSSKAHFLAGVHGLFVLYKGAFWDAFNLSEHSALGEMSEALNAMYALRPAQVWEPSELATHPAWAEVRSLALLVLVEAGIGVEAPLRPLDIRHAEDEFGWSSGACT
jgi:hypothetical protein